MKEVMSKVRLSEEEAWLSYMQGAFNASTILQILSVQERARKGGMLSAYMKGYYFPISEKLAGNVYRVCHGVLEELQFDSREVEFYISNDQDINAVSIYNHEEDEPHCIVMNAGLLEILDEEEIKFVVGHEVGHLLFEHSLFNKVIQFIYPQYDRLPPHLKGLYDLWEKLGEISADRVGLLAVKDLDPAITAMFRISSGLNKNSLSIDTRDFLVMVDKLLDQMSKEPSHIFHSHPANPIRVKAIDLFYRSDTWKSIRDDGKYAEDEKLDKDISRLIEIIKKKPTGPLESAELDLFASAGFILMTADQEINPEEYDQLINILSQYLYWPHDYLKRITEKKGRVKEVLKKSSALIVENYPERTRFILKNLVPILLRDRKLHDNEVGFFMTLADDYLKIPVPEAVDILLAGLRELYSPLA